MSTENEVNEEPKAPVDTVEAAVEPSEEEAPKETPEEDVREKIEWPGSKGEGAMQLHFFDITGLPETIEDEVDPQGRIVLALIAELQQLRMENHDLKAAVQYMSLQDFMDQKGHASTRGNRPPPAAMYRLANGK